VARSVFTELALRQSDFMKGKWPFGARKTNHAILPPVAIRCKEAKPRVFLEICNRPINKRSDRPR
jgi:hypothetical protein